MTQPQVSARDTQVKVERWGQNLTKLFSSLPSRSLLALRLIKANFKCMTPVHYACLWDILSIMQSYELSLVIPVSISLGRHAHGVFTHMTLLLMRRILCGCYDYF